MRRSAALLAAVALTGVTAATARADDYDLASSEWNGLSTFGAVARGLGLRVAAISELRYDDLEPGDVLLLLYPTASIDPSRVSAFVRQGGRVVIADDFGAGSKLLSHLGLLREPAGALVDTPRYRDLAYSPIAEPRAGAGPLADGVRSLVANHPAVFSRTAGFEPIFAFSSGEVLVAAGTVGEGRVVALADPSVLINRMLELEDNLQFAINLVRYVSREGRDQRLVVVTGSVRESGRPPGPPDDPSLEAQLSRAAHGLNGAADELREYLLTEHGLRAAAIALAALVAILCAAAPSASRAPVGDWVRARPRAPRRAGSGGDFAVPAAVLRDNLERRLGARLGCRAPLSTLPEHELYRRVDRQIGRPAALALARVVPLVAEIPARPHAGARGAPAVSRRAFERLHSAASRLEKLVTASATRD